MKGFAPAVLSVRREGLAGVGGGLGRCEKNEREGEGGWYRREKYWLLVFVLV